MAREPFPIDDTPAEPPAAAGATDKKPLSTRTRKLVAGAAIGIGSAALVAALLYANRSRGGDRA
jgi:hypothetical protein